MAPPYKKPTYAMLRERFRSRIEDGFKHEEELFASLERHRMENALFLEFNDTTTSQTMTFKPDVSNMLDDASQKRVKKLGYLLNGGRHAPRQKN